MDIDELQQKFNEMRKKKWRMVDGRQPVEITGFFIDSSNRPVIVGGTEYSVFNVNPETLYCIYSGVLVIEEVRPYHDWPIDAKAWFWDEGSSKKHKGYFAGVHVDGRPTSWYGGRTSWTASNQFGFVVWDHAELAEDVE